MFGPMAPIGENIRSGDVYAANLFVINQWVENVEQTFDPMGSELDRSNPEVQHMDKKDGDCTNLQSGMFEQSIRLDCTNMQTCMGMR
jgi:hypothetical protein